MAKFLCRCGAVIHTSGLVPNPVEWRLISDELLDEFDGVVSIDSLYKSAVIGYRCARCGRLWIYWNGFAAEPVSYAPEAEPPTPPVSGAE
jgi:hypothetical protein